MPNGNPEVCLIKKTVCDILNIGFILEVDLFPSGNSSNSAYVLLGDTIQIGKPLAAQLVKELEIHAYRDVIVVSKGKDYSARINVSKEDYKYKLMDIDRTVLLGYISERAFRDFAGV